MKNIIFPVNVENTQPEKYIICTGIDLGTTYTLMARVDSVDVDFTQSNSIPVQYISIRQYSPDPYDPEIHDEKVASMLAIYEGKPYVGNNLYHLKGKEGFEYRKNMFYHWKVDMGIEHFPMYPDAVMEQLDMPYKVAGGILNYCRKSALRNKDQVLEYTVVTVPASFQVNQRKDVIRACETAKINSPILIDEPNAAFLGYFNKLDEAEKQEWANNVRNKNVLVVDFGGGTLDLSILNVDFRRDSGISIANRAISRYNDLGGQDLDSLIAEEYLYPKLKAEFPIVEDIAHGDIVNILLPQLAVYGEQLKISICDALSLKAADKDVESIEYQSVQSEIDDCVVSYRNEKFCLGTLSMDGEQFKSLFLKLFSGKRHQFQLQDKEVTSVSQSISDIIEKSDLTLDEIDFVLYVGGSSFNPFLVSLTKKKLKNSVSLESPEPDKLVVEGAAVFSYFYYVHGLSLISPITSETIGIRLKGDRFYPLIEKGAQLPIKVRLPEFKLQSNLNNEIVIPVCINGIDYPIGEIRATLDGFRSSDDIVSIEATITADKVFELKAFVGDEFVGDGDFENPFSVGKVSEEELDILMTQRKLNQLRKSGNTQEEKRTLRDLLWKHSAVNNNAGTVETAEKYISRFDDQDSNVWNLVYCANSAMGRAKAAKNALEKALEISPNEPSYIYNYSLILEKSSGKEALEFLQGKDSDLLEDEGIRCKIVLLKNDCDMDCKDEALEIVEHYKSNSYQYSDFDKKVLLPGVFRIADESYSYVSPKKNSKHNDESNYLDKGNDIVPGE